MPHEHRLSAIHLVHVEVPFQHSFEHAGHRRDSGDTLLLGLVTETGYRAWSEVLPRAYVSGESIENILSVAAAELAARWLGRNIVDQTHLCEALEHERRANLCKPALLAGLDIALWQLLDHYQAVDIDALLGPLRTSPSGSCLTIDFSVATSDLRKSAMLARLSGATVVKQKIGREDDIERLQELRRTLKDSLPIRLDANSRFDVASLELLLEALTPFDIESIEDPLDGRNTDLHADLGRLYRQYQVPFVADESVTSDDDLRQLLACEGAWQGVNLRLGKMGGLWGTRQVRDLALQHGLGLVAGTLVGEGRSLNDAATVFLAHSGDLAYVEGLGQNRHFLRMDPLDTDTDSLHRRTNPSEPVLQPLKVSALLSDDLIKSRQSFEL